MRGKVNKWIGLILAFIVILITISNVNKQAESMRNLEAKQITDGSTMQTVIARFLGIKVATTDILWVKQTLAIGGMAQGEVTPANEVYLYSREMSDLNPYFVGNYYFSGTVLGMIDYYRQFSMASNIFQTGIEYLPLDPYIKNYYAGVMAYSQGDDAQALSNFEKVAQQYHDPTLINTIAILYLMKYNKTNNLDDLNQAIQYWKENAVSSNGYYSERAINMLKKYTNYQN